MALYRGLRRALSIEREAEAQAGREHALAKIEALRQRISEPRAQHDLAAAQGACLGRDRLEQLRAMALPALGFSRDQIVDIEMRSMDEVFLPPITRQCHGRAILPGSEQAIAQWALAPDIGDEIRGRGERRAKLAHHRKAKRDLGFAFRVAQCAGHEAFWRDAASCTCGVKR